jgi:hypothetical protein
MYHDTHRQHGYELAPSGRTASSADIGECLFAVDRAALTLQQHETQWVMDRLLRECLGRKPLD